jgi:hypothetical protein
VAGYIDPGSQIDVFVFDETHLLHSRRIETNPDLHHPGHDFWFEDGNRTLKYRSEGGDGSYDVLSDVLTPPKQDK